MQKKLLMTLCGLFAICIAKAQVSFRGYYSNTTGPHGRISVQKKVYRKIGLNTGYNVDGLGIGHLEATYEIFPGVNSLLGFGYHHYQDGLHPSIGISWKKEVFNLEVSGHARVLFNHLYHAGFELEVIRNLNKKWGVGLVVDCYTGKKFMSLKEAEERYVLKHPEYETETLVGLMVVYRINDKFSFSCFVISGVQNEQHENNFSDRGGIDFTYHFPE